MPLVTGSRIGHYEILSPLGSGGMGEVYRAHDTRLDRTVAVKSLPPGLERDPARLARFEREARLLASLQHPNIAGIFGLEEADGHPYLVLEFVDGETLAQRLARGPMSVRETLAVAGEIAAAVAAAHARGIVHRDLKPGNVMLTATRAVKVLDFGLAKAEDPSGGASLHLSATPTRAASITHEGAVLGTGPYMSPEQARGKLTDGRTDLWALGCILYECLAGRQAFPGPTMSDILVRILDRDPDWGALPDSTPPRLRELLRRCLAKDAEARPADAGELGRELAAAAQELEARAADATPSSAGGPSLAVLYFENMGQDPDSDYFCSGITEDILTDLFKIRGMRVASRNAVARYRGAPADIPRIARELGVGAVLEGSVRRAGNRVRITAQLISAADGFHLWAERYDRTLEDVFAVQEEIASSIAAALRVALTPVETEKLGADRPQDVRAYDLYLKGRQEYARYRREPTLAALDLFRQAIALDPEYALAWAGVADCYGQLVQWEWMPAEEGIRLGLEAARRASALNPRLPDAYKAEALALRFAGDRQGTRAALVKALEADPRHVPALINLGVELFSDADLAGSERLYRRCLEIDPQQPFATVWLESILSITTRLDETLELADHLRRITSETAYLGAVYGYRGVVAVLRGDADAARQAVREGLEAGMRPAMAGAIEILLAVHTNRLDDAGRLLQEPALDEIGSGMAAWLATAAVRLGEHERALRILTRRVNAQLAPVFARLLPDLHPLLGQAPLAPRRLDATLVWPLEAPMMDAACHGLFREVKIESGRPQGSDLDLWAGA